MKKILLLLVFLVLASVGTAAYLMLCKPDTAAGQWIKSQYDAYVLPHVSTALTQKGAPEAEPAPATDPAPDAEPTTEPAADVVAAAETEPTDPEPEVEETTPATSETPASAEKSAPAQKPKPFSKENWYVGKRLQASDIRGKVVLVYVWDAQDARSVAMLPRVQQTWDGFKHKPFTVIGSHRGTRSKDVLKVLKSKKVSFPVYQDAFLPCEPKEIPSMPYFYVSNPNGKLIYRGVSDVGAIEAVVNAISNAIGR